MKKLIKQLFKFGIVGGTAFLIDYSILFVWLIIGIVLSVIGIKTINKYENSYVKVIK